MDWYEYKYNPRVSLKKLIFLKDWYYKKKGLICVKSRKKLIYYYHQTMLLPLLKIMKFMKRN